MYDFGDESFDNKRVAGTAYSHVLRTRARVGRPFVDFRIDTAFGCSRQLLGEIKRRADKASHLVDRPVAVCAFAGGRETRTRVGGGNASSLLRDAREEAEKKKREAREHAHRRTRGRGKLVYVPRVYAPGGNARTCRRSRDSRREGRRRREREREKRGRQGDRPCVCTTRRVYQATSVVTAIVPTTSPAGRHPRSIRLSSFPSRPTWSPTSRRKPPAFPLALGSPLVPSSSSSRATPTPPSKLFFPFLLLIIFSFSLSRFLSLPAFPVRSRGTRLHFRPKSDLSGGGPLSGEPVQFAALTRREYTLRECRRRKVSRVEIRLDCPSASASVPETRTTCRRDITAGGTKKNIGKHQRDRVSLARYTFDSMSIMRCLLMLQILIAVVQPNLEARQRVSNIRGVYTPQEHLHDHEIVIPRKVNFRGDLISHNVTHHHHEDGPIVHYRVAVAGNEYHLELSAADNFIGRAMVVERRKRSLHVRSPAKNHGSKCHYRGFIKGHRNSHVALSACDGLAGMLRGDHGEFWLEPVAVSLEEKRGTSSVDEATTGDLGAGVRSSVHGVPAAGRPHLVFRRSAEQQQQQQQQLEIVAGGGRSRRRRKKKRKQERNCGTREPRRLTETRLEWQTQPGLVQVQGRGRRKHHQAKRWHRSKRSISTPRHVEALVVADTTMMAFHQDGDVETYLLTIMNMVSALYLDPTIGNFINIVVVRIILVEEEDAEQGLNITVNADRTLYNFCKWQQKLNPSDDSHPNHHDVAILVTREDICSRANTPCSTLGVAHVAGMCQPDRSCSVNEDNGITLAHTITHELGHNFGMYHDTEKIGCSKREGDTLHVMTPTFEVDAVGVAWSRCSRRDITNFLDQGKGDCLEDEPADNSYAYPDLPPGAMYDAEHQCRLQFGVREASVCLTSASLHEICSKLWCFVDGSCTSMMHPAAPGTHCGKHMWCQNQECVPIVDRPRHIDGGWGEWGSWSECSRTCGAGVSIVERKCDHPEPAHGGKFCIGERRRYKICNTQPCPEGAPSFRAVQCSDYDGKEYKGKNYTWLPYFDQTEPCELYCTDTEESVIVPWGEAALDGTPCNVGTRDMCIAGICRKVGCDWTVDSDATEDRCGICHGDGTQCETTSGVYDKNDGPGYKEVIIIPSGSRNIKIEEISNSKNYIGIGIPNSDKYFLNGKRQITLAGEYDVAGTPALYERDRDKEKIRIPGPIKEDIVVYLIYRGHYRNFGLRYEYTVPKKEPDRAPEYSWVSSDWTLCTVTCGGGTQTSHAVCHERKSGVVEDHFCDGIEKPEPKVRECNSNPCPARWWVGPWQMCPVTCGDSVLRKRSVMCVFSGAGTDRSDLALPDRDCDKNMRPEELEPCPDLPPCGPTSEVPLIVYADNKDTSFYNISLNEQDMTIVDGLTTEEPEILEFDNVVDENPDNSMYNTKSKWTVSKWSHCSNGKRSRKVTCSIPGDCNPDNKPPSVEDCYSGKWISGKWGSCNATCLIKLGVKHREVQCRDRQTDLLSDDCNLGRRPFDTKRCYYRRQCPTNEKNDCKNSTAASCANHKHICDPGKQCCATCKRRRHVRHNRRYIFTE